MTRLPLLCALALAMAAPAVASGQHEWRAVDAETGRIKQSEGLQELARDFPDSGSVRLRLLTRLLEEGDIEPLFEALAWLNERGYVFGSVSQDQIPKLVGDNRAEAARSLLIPSVMAIGASEVIASVPAEAGLVESVFASTTDDTLVVTSVSDKSVWIRQAGSWQRMAIARADNLSGIVSDTIRNIGWIASGRIDGSDAEEKGFSGLIGLTGGDGILYIAAPEGVALSDIAIGPDGIVYASDPIGGGVFRKDDDSDALSPLVAPGVFRSPQGLAVSEDNQLLYVSDYNYGIAVVDLGSGKVSRLSADIPVILDGVDGLWLHGRELVAVQNGTSPFRISAFELSEDGFSVIGQRVLEQANPDWTEPLSGSIAGSALYYVGTGQWDRWVNGAAVEGKPFTATHIRKLPLDR